MRRIKTFVPGIVLLSAAKAEKLLGWEPVRDREAFFREAIDSHLKPFKQDDLRLEGHALAKA